MKRALIAAICMLLMVITTVEAKKKLMSIQIKKGSLRTAPSFLGKVMANVSYGDRVSVMQVKRDWSKVSPIKNDKAGWIHKSALSKKKIVLKADAKQNVGASSGELALAGKGFNSEVESEFKAKNKDIDFTWIDKMEKFKVSHAQMQAFLSTGSVTSKGGAK